MNIPLNANKASFNHINDKQDIARANSNSSYGPHLSNIPCLLCDIPQLVFDEVLVSTIEAAIFMQDVHAW